MATTQIATPHPRHLSKKSKREKLLEETKQLQEKLRNLTGSVPLTESLAMAMMGRRPAAQAAPASQTQSPVSATTPPGPASGTKPPPAPAPQPAPHPPLTPLLLHPALGKKTRSPEPVRHGRKCSICRHPEREAIEEAFLQWESPRSIVRDFKIEDERYLRRHAQATGLYVRRRRNVCVTLENILERGDDIEFTAASYIRAVRSYVCLTDSTQWVEPATRAIVSSGDSSIGSQPAPRRRRPGSVRVPAANSNRPRPRLEITVTRTKQRKEAGSNRP
ncbi:MAG: hypothetical protein ACYDCD_08515 [Candidatus Acidiferrales bacterium]